MTPLWKEVMRAMLAEKVPERMGLDAMALARCFDLRDVQTLLFETSRELRAAAVEPPPKVPLPAGMTLWQVDIGPRACLPAPVTWLEFGDGALLVDSRKDGVALATAFLRFRDVTTGAPQEIKNLLGFLDFSDGIADIYVAAPDFATAAFMGLAGLAAINSPASVQSNIEPHRGFVRDMRRLGVDVIARKITHTKVTLGRSYGRGDGVGANEHPKAYHFCRAHIRQRANGKTERVRAHWRGDVAFGVRLPAYRVAGQEDLR